MKAKRLLLLCSAMVGLYPNAIWAQSESVNPKSAVAEHAPAAQAPQPAQQAKVPVAVVAPSPAGTTPVAATSAKPQVVAQPSPGGSSGPQPATHKASPANTSKNGPTHDATPHSSTED